MIDKRDSPPAGYTAEEYGAKVASRLPMSSLTRRDSYCLKAYIDLLKTTEWLCDRHEDDEINGCRNCIIEEVQNQIDELNNTIVQLEFQINTMMEVK